MGLFGVLLLAVLAVLAPLATAEEWYDKEMINCYDLLSIDPAVDTAEVMRAVRRVTSRTHPDRCKVKAFFFVEVESDTPIPRCRRQSARSSSRGQTTVRKRWGRRCGGRRTTNA